MFDFITWTRLRGASSPSIGRKIPINKKGRKIIEENKKNTHRNFFHQILDLADHLMSVGLVNVRAEGDLPLLAGLRYGGNSEHLAR